MSTRYVYSSEPKFYHQNGLTIDKRELPSNNSIKYFLNAILGSMIVKVNPIKRHKCTSMCMQMIQVMLGYPHCENLVMSGKL